MANLKTLAHQFQIAEQALQEAENHIKARYYASAISHAFQVPLRAAAGLLYGLQLHPITEKEVRIAFHSAFIGRGLCDARFDETFRSLERMRHKADFDHDYMATVEEAQHALALAREFWAEALRLQKEAAK